MATKKTKKPMAKTMPKMPMRGKMSPKGMMMAEEMGEPKMKKAKKPVKKGKK